MHAHSHLTTRGYWSALAVMAGLLILPPTQVATMGAVLLAPFALLVSWLAGIVFANTGRAAVMGVYVLFCGLLYINCFMDWLAAM